ncbi:MAG TPA: UDP-N-acetylglucosamine 1-carboxyvinyltransferase [Kofleriaceae bacterium]|nr:UDP-N-acetylglucosamine 1-carboxyvinyltransferase [Kofleriaceae bacterium]
MDQIVIHGGARLCGSVQISGAKNAALPLLASSLLASGTCTYDNVPRLGDVKTLCALLAKLGCEVAVKNEGRRVVVLPPTTGEHTTAPYELVKTMRASVLVLGPLVARFGHARVSLPGGCAIGARPIDQHLKGLEAMGADVELSHGYVEVRCEKLRGARIVLDIPTVTGCENLMMAAALADGQTFIENAAREPEIEELAQALNKMGADIRGAGTPIIEIRGVPELLPIEHAILPDRIEAGTFLVAGAVTGGDVLVCGARADHLDAVLSKLRAAGATITIEAGGIRVCGPERLSPVDITTQPYPGFPTDMQAQLMVVAAIADGQSVIKEAIFENRFMHVSELARMGADIHADGRVAVIRGVPALEGAPVMATDLRASASLVLAGLCARGKTEVRRVYHLDRGYEHIEDKLVGLGARVERVAA